MDGLGETARAGGLTFDQAAARVFASLVDGQRQRSEDLNEVRRALQALLMRYRLSETDAQDGAQEILASIFAHGPTVVNVHNPAAYLTRLARNRAIDEFRRSRRQDVSMPDEFVDMAEDDRTSALLDASVTAANVERALNAAHAAGDQIGVRIVGTWLDLAQKNGVEPSSREVGRGAGVSHTSVNQALKRFRNYLLLPDDDPDTSYDRGQA